MKIFLCATLLFFPLAVQTDLANAQDLEWNNAVTTQDKGLVIAKRHKLRGAGWVDASSGLTMTIRDNNGSERLRKLVVKSLEVDNDGDKRLMIFRAPKDISGTAFLSHSHVNDADDQWIFLPDLKRVKRISSNNKAGAFMGSEFSYEDLSSFEIAKYDFSLSGEEDLNGLPCYILESYPKDVKSGYSRLTSWIDKKELLVRKTIFYDRNENLLKVLALSNYQKFDGRFWRPGLATMKNHQTGSVTELNYGDIRLGSGLSDSNFTISSLRRAH